MEIRIGKIQDIKFGRTGYQNAQLGYSVTLGSDKDSWGVGDSKGGWDYEQISIGEYTKWTEEDRSSQMVEMLKRISKLLSDAKVEYLHELKGKPVECKFENNTLKEWRILTEVI